MQSPCRSNLGHRLLYGLGEYFNPDRTVPANFFLSLVRGSNLEQKFIRTRGANDAHVKDILTFLKRGGRFDVTKVIRNGDEIDCSRFCFKVLEVFGRAKVENQTAIEQGEFWEAYAKVAAQAFVLSKTGHSKAIDSKLLFCPLLDKFRQTSSWKLRANIVRGFKTIAFDIPKRDPIFWDTCLCFLNHYEAASLPYLGKRKFPKPVREGISHVVDLWRILATKYGSDEIIQKKVVKVASRLLNLIDMAELELHEGLMRLNEALVALNFDTVDYITGEEPSRPRQIQSQLESLAFKLIPFVHKTDNKSVQETLNALLPYLWGAKNPRDRRVPCGEYSDGRIRISKLRSFAAHINDICALSYRAFNITINGISLKKDYDPGKHYRGNRISRIPCQRISCKYEGLKRFVSIDRIDLEVPFINQGGEKSHLIMPCGIHRAVKVSDNVSRWVVWAPKTYKRNIPSAWRTYVNSLKPRVGRLGLKQV